MTPGDLSLSRFEDDLSGEWSKCGNDHPPLRSFRVTSAFWTVLRSAADRHRADVVLVDVGLSLDVINRAALVASDHLVVPVSPDLFSLQGLHNLGPTLRRWRAHEEAHRVFSFALACAEQADDWHLRTQVMGNLALQAMWTGRPCESQDLIFTAIT